ncbi:hypothetical protein TGP89_419710 [Toxoplasma gondii p89]|uniref:Uncharacterized protein n=1 Tax=Toxoplasma gondii p89 TaxID=943119 RepID=A0A086K5L6_TOXGO|nr:hypothetical protein TGP89_419710 [Toxoplasma gondii p89]
MARRFQEAETSVSKNKKFVPETAKKYFFRPRMAISRAVPARGQLRAAARKDPFTETTSNAGLRIRRFRSSRIRPLASCWTPTCRLRMRPRVSAGLLVLPSTRFSRSSCRLLTPEMSPKKPNARAWNSRRPRNSGAHQRSSQRRSPPRDDRPTLASSRCTETSPFGLQASQCPSRDKRKKNGNENS